MLLTSRFKFLCGMQKDG